MKTTDIDAKEARPVLRGTPPRTSPAELVWTAEATSEIREDCPTWREFTGQTLEEMQGFGWLDAVHPEDRERVRKIWTDAAGTSSIYQVEYRVRRADGEWRYLSVRGVPVRDHGEIHKWVGYCRDVTETHNYLELLKRERDFSNGIIECLPGFFYITDETGNLLRWNRNAETILGYSAEEVAQKRGYEFVHPESRGLSGAAKRRAIETGAYQELEADYLTKSGKRVPIFLSGRRMVFEGKVCVMGVGLDISKLKDAERKLRELNTTLEHRVKERTAQLEQSNKDLEAFSYTVSHDLQSPLKAIGGFAEILQKVYCEQLQGEGQGLLLRIIEANQRMARLIDDVLRYSLTGHAAIKLVSVPMTQLIKNVENDFDLRLKQIGGEFGITSDLPAVEGDPTLLAQVFSNLFQNSINYRRKDVPLKLKVNAREEKHDVVFSVSDNGAGIAPEHQEKVFEPFRRVRNDKQTPGSGLGLATVKRAVEMMGGKVWIESEVGQGTTFFIRLKAAG